MRVVFLFVMCSQPYLIKNFNFINPNNYNPRIGAISTNATKYSNLHDTIHQYIAVPCGHCFECRQLSQAYITQRAREQFKDSYCIFITLTYQNSAIPYIMLSGYKHYYADIRDFQLFIKRVRRRYDDIPEFSYLCCSEYGGERHRPHFHCLLFFKRSLFDDEFDALSLAERFEEIIKLEWKRKVGGTQFDPIFEPLSKFIKLPDGTGTYDCHLVTQSRGSSDDPTDVAYYVSKYCLKYDEWIENKRGMLYHNYPDDYKKLWKLFRPRMLLSKGFGITNDTADFIHRCISFSKTNNFQTPQYFFDNDSKSLPLSRYYQHKFMKVSDKAHFIVVSKNAFFPDNAPKDIPMDGSKCVRCLSPFDLDQLSKRQKRFEQICKTIYDQSDNYLVTIDDDLPVESFEMSQSFVSRGAPEHFFDNPIEVSFDDHF